MAETKEIAEFDYDRLAQEIDNIFQDKFKKTYKLFDDTTLQILDKRNKEFDGIIKEKKKAVREILANIREELIAEIQKGRTTIVLPNQQEIEIEHMDHPKMEAVVKSLQLTNKAMLVGPAGTGKTFMIGSIAERMSLPFYKYSCSRDSSVHDLLGYKQPKSETYLETTFLKAYENGGIFLVDEYDAMSGDMALFFNGIADGSKFLSVPHRDEKPQAIKHKDFYLVMCGNTWGKGSTDYSGKDFQDMALMDRFRFCRHYIGYHTTLEQQFIPEYEIVTELRKHLEEVGSYLSTRNVEDMSKLIGAGISMKEAVAMLLEDLSDTEKKEIQSKLSKGPAQRALTRQSEVEASWFGMPEEVPDEQARRGAMDFERIVRGVQPPGLVLDPTTQSIF